MPVANKLGALLCLGLTPLIMGAMQESEQPHQRTEVIEKSKTVPFKVKYEFSRNVVRGRIQTKQAGKPGLVTQVYEVQYEGDKVVGKKLVETKTIPAQDEIHLMGTYGFQTSRSSFSRGSVRIMNSTAYLPSAGLGSRATFKTKMGLPAKYGVVAVDPRVIPLGTFLYIEGYGFGYACDTGGAIKGNIIDVCLPTNSEVRNWGRRKVRVHILKK